MWGILFVIHLLPPVIPPLVWQGMSMFGFCQRFYFFTLTHLCICMVFSYKILECCVHYFLSGNHPQNRYVIYKEKNISIFSSTDFELGVFFESFIQHFSLFSGFLNNPLSPNFCKRIGPQFQTEEEQKFSKTCVIFTAV